MASQAYNNIKGNLDTQISAASAPDPYNSIYSQIAGSAEHDPQIQDQDWSDVDSSMSGLSSIAKAFLNIYQQGSPVAAAQNAILNGQFERAANTGRMGGQQVQNAGQQVAQQAGANEQNAQNSAAQQSTQISGFDNLAGLRKAGIQLQLTHAAAQQAIQKSSLASQARLTAASALEAQQTMIQNAQASEQQIQTGQDALTFQNWANGFALAGGALASGTAIGAKLGNSNTGGTTGVNPVSTATSLSGSDENAGVASATEVPEIEGVG